jgi:hypothetical protein
LRRKPLKGWFCNGEDEPAYPEQFRCEAVELVRQGRSMLAAIEAGVDAVLVGDRIRALKAERQRSPKSTTTGAEEPASTSTKPAPSSTDYPTSTTPSPPPAPSSAVRSTTPSASASSSTATRPRYD